MLGRRFLFLQGPTSPFFSALADKLLALGAEVFRVNFNMGDRVYWPSKPSVNFRKSPHVLHSYLQSLIQEKNITDAVMLGDTRSVNAPMTALASANNVRLHVFDDGYFRPHWLTMEEDGINAFSLLPKDPAWYRKAAALVPKPTAFEPVSSGLTLLALHEIGYHTPNLLNPLFYPGYRTHRPYVSGIELAGWAIRFALMPLYEKKDNSTIATLLQAKHPFFVLPLQLGSDSQMQVHSPFSSVKEKILLTLRSFAQFAPRESYLVIKNHPLDIGLSRFKQYIKKQATLLGIETRVIYLESGNLEALLQKTTGVVVANSTVGLSALEAGCPTLALGKAIYKMPGLTTQCTLDAFWQAPEKPDAQLFADFKHVVMHCALINGNFFSTKGIEVGVENTVARLKLSESPLTSLLKRIPLN